MNYSGVYSSRHAYEAMLSPTKPNHTAVPFDGLTDVQVRVVAARFIDGESWGRIAFREGWKSRNAARKHSAKGIKRVRANGWDFVEDLAQAA